MSRVACAWREGYEKVFPEVFRSQPGSAQARDARPLSSALGCQSEIDRNQSGAGLDGGAAVGEVADGQADGDRHRRLRLRVQPHLHRPGPPARRPSARGDLRRKHSAIAISCWRAGGLTTRLGGLRSARTVPALQREVPLLGQNLRLQLPGLGVRTPSSRAHAPNRSRGSGRSTHNI